MPVEFVAFFSKKNGQKINPVTARTACYMTSPDRTIVWKRNLPITHHYMRIRIEYEPVAQLSAISAMATLTTAAQNMFGSLGAAQWHVDLLDWDLPSQTGIVAMDHVYAFIIECTLRDVVGI